MFKFSRNIEKPFSPKRMIDFNIERRVIKDAFNEYIDATGFVKDEIVLRITTDEEPLDPWVPQRKFVVMIEEIEE